MREVGSLPSHQLLWFLASITSTQDSNQDLPAPRRVALPLGHRVGILSINLASNGILFAAKHVDNYQRIFNKWNLIARF